MKSPIDSIKHIVQFTPTGVASGANASMVMVDALARGSAIGTTADVIEGAVVKAIYVEIWVKNDNPNFAINAVALKMPGGIAFPTVSEMSNLDSYANKKNIFVIHQGLAPSGDQVMPVYREWIRIPKGKQRFGLGDRFGVRILYTGSAGDFCGFATYKEYR